MRLDHLLSTEFCGAPVWRPFRDDVFPALVGVGVVPAGVEEIKDLLPALWVGGGAVHAVGSPDRHAPCVGWVFRAHGSGAACSSCRAGLWCGGGLRTGEWTRATAASVWVWLVFVL